MPYMLQAKIKKKLIYTLYIVNVGEQTRMT